MDHEDAKIASLIKCKFESFIGVVYSLVNVNNIVDNFVVSSLPVTSNSSFCNIHTNSQRKAIKKRKCLSENLPTQRAL